MVRVVRRIKGAPDLLIKRIASETSALLSSGAPILNLSQGSPNLPPFDSAVDAAVAVLESRRLPYTDVAGEAGVREVCANFLNRIVLGREESGDRDEEQGAAGAYTAEHVCLTNGAVGAVYCALAIQVESEDDVVVSPLPAYGLYISDAAVLGGTFRPLTPSGGPEEGFALTPADVRGAFHEHGGRLRCLILCYPNNPTGKCLSPDEAKDLAAELDCQLAMRRDSFSVLLDEVYTGIGPGHSSLLRYASPALRRVCIVALSASKGLGGAPGARGGFVACADPDLVGQMAKVQMATGANLSVPSQKMLGASLRHVLSDPGGVMGEVYAHYRARTDVVCKRLEELGEKYAGGDRRAFCPRRPEGTFYVLGRFPCLGETDLDVQRVLRDAYKSGVEGVENGVAVVPLSAFLMDKHSCMVRICCAVDMDVLSKAMDVVDMMVSASVKNSQMGAKFLSTPQLCRTVRWQ